jgi:hypothetical protein
MTMSIQMCLPTELQLQGSTKDRTAQQRPVEAVQHLIPRPTLCYPLAHKKVDDVPLTGKHLVDIPVAEDVAFIGVVFFEAALVGRKSS